VKCEVVGRGKTKKIQFGVNKLDRFENHIPKFTFSKTTESPIRIH